LIEAYIETVYACATYNAQAVAAVPIKLYARTGAGQTRPRATTRPVTKAVRARLEKSNIVQPGEDVDEIVEHPLLDLLAEANEVLDQYSLLMVTELHLDLVGRAYWYLQTDGLGVPVAVWPLPPHHVTELVDESGSPVPAGYRLAPGRGEPKVYKAAEVIAFRRLNPANPYFGGWSPTRAAWQSVSLLNADLGYMAKAVRGENIPSVLLSPRERIGDQEAKRTERRFDTKYRYRGGAFVVEDAMDVTPLTPTSAQMELVERTTRAKVAVCNAFGVPPMLLDPAQVSRANVEAGIYLHARSTVLPRVVQRDGVLNHRLVKLYDERLFLVSDDPVESDNERDARIRRQYADGGIMTINEIRAEMGLPEVAWGNEPYRPAAAAAATPGDMGTITERPIGFTNAVSQ